MHQCNIADKINFFEGSSNYANEINKAFLNMFCIDDLSEIMLFGNENTDDCQMMILEVLPCKGKQCLPLSNLYTNWPQFYTITNTQTYDKTQYDQSKVISNSTSINNHIISTATPHLDRGKISVNWLNLYQMKTRLS